MNEDHEQLAAIFVEALSEVDGSASVATDDDVAIRALVLKALGDIENDDDETHAYLVVEWSDEDVDFDLIEITRRWLQVSQMG